MAVKHNHDLDGKLHDKCPSCEIIRHVSKPTRLKAYKEVDYEVEHGHLINDRNPPKGTK